MLDIMLNNTSVFLPNTKHLHTIHWRLCILDYLIAYYPHTASRRLTHSAHPLFLCPMKSFILHEPNIGALGHLKDINTAYGP